MASAIQFFIALIFKRVILEDLTLGVKNHSRSALAAMGYSASQPAELFSSSRLPALCRKKVALVEQAAGQNSLVTTTAQTPLCPPVPRFVCEEY